jgi:hypothetical protein
MIEIDKLRKADLFSGSAILLLGLFMIGQATQMPMKDSYAGVQNVWYVSPALFPLLVGSMLALLGLLLIKTAFKEVGSAGLLSVLKYLSSSDFISFLRLPATIRFYGITLNLFIFVFLLVPRVDFFLAAILFLLIFFLMFYCGSESDLLTLIYLMLAATLLFGLVVLTPLASSLATAIPFISDILIIGYIASLIFYYFIKLKGVPELMPKFKLSLLIAFAAPLTIGIIFKYFLLVPMPFEGLVVTLLDAIWYADIWS